MKTKQPRSQTVAAAPAQQQAWNMFADFGRQQMAVANDGATALLRGFETIRKIQEQTAHQARTRHEAAAEKLKRSCTANDVLAIQSELMRVDLEAASRYWQDLGAAALEMQTELLGCATQIADADALLETASTLDHFESAIPGLEAMFTPKASRASRRGRVA